MSSESKASFPLVGSLVSVLAILAVLAAPATAFMPPGGTAPRGIEAKKFVRVAPAGKDPVLLEGGAFGPGGDFYFVNALAPAGAPKVLRLDLESKKLTSLYTDSTATFTSAQFDPRGGRLYLTDFGGGSIDSMNADGSDFRVDFAGKVGGRGITPDDIAFDRQGALFLTDSTGTPWDPTGRVVRFEPGATHPTVLMEGLAAPNGISFTPDYSSLWISEYTAQQEDLLVLDPERREVVASGIAMRANTGLGGFDSNAVDAAGNIYQCVYEDGKILVWGDRGELKAEISIPQNLGKPELAATNLGIKPGTRQGYIVVGGESGGFVYRFKALGKGIPLASGGVAGSENGA